MASLKEVKNRISSVKSTRQITSAMKMVASAKLHKVQGRIENMLPYQRKLNEILTNFLRTDASFQSPYTEKRPVTRVAVVAFSSNSSLCGAFNSNVAKMLERTLEDYQSLGKENILIYPVGRKVEEAVRKMGYVSQGSFQVMADKPSYVEAYGLAEKLMREFVEKRIDHVELIYHHFKSMGSQVLFRENYLPIDLTQVVQEAEEGMPEDARSFNNDYIVEPSVGELIAELLPKVLSQKIFTVLLDSSTSEHAARMLAMQTATDNANELIQDLTKQYNKSRQQAITNELLTMMCGTGWF
ncbi:F0F1 ATP synthase subunit gamma [uncultured Bacteroides sp.]|uniref:F0F1 ATP synthase subunit gamma n=1 Tax=uncultured Bacteroides sp. TaxID=162156 RepID=UPI00272D3D14|nr:F0F1 ATP synthase subunit gamma [uncultured Bacteroides sp.]